MKHCDAIDIDVTPAGPVFRRTAWPAEINVNRNLLDYLPGPHVQFGRMGILRFTCTNGYAVYRRLEDVPGGWNYRLVEHQLKAAAPAATKPAELAPTPAASAYRRVVDGAAFGPVVEAFQWLPHAVPPVALPGWFMRSDFEHNAAGELVIRQPGGAVKAAPSDWIVNEVRMAVVKAAKFAQEYAAV